MKPPPSTEQRHSLLLLTVFWSVKQYQPHPADVIILES